MRTTCRIGLTIAVVLAARAPSAAQEIRLRPLSPVYVDATGSPIDSPRSVGCGRGASLVVADTGNGRLLSYSIDERGTHPTRTIAPGELPRPVHVATAPDKTLFVLDGKRRKIGRIDAAGTFQGYVEPSEGAEHFAPRSFRVADDGTLWVLDTYGPSVRLLDDTGSVVRTITFPEESVAPADLTLDARGTVYVIDSVARRVFAAAPDAGVFSALGDTLEGKAEFPAAIAADDGGRLFVADKNGGSILILGTDGSFRGRRSGFGWKEGLLRYPSGLCLDGSGRLFVADRANDRVQVFAILQ